jgi:predicted nicotinamide N-methyase
MGTANPAWDDGVVVVRFVSAALSTKVRSCHAAPNLPRCRPSDRARVAWHRIVAPLSGALPAERKSILVPAQPSADRIAALLAQLPSDLALQDVLVTVPGGNETLTVTRPLDTDLLLDRATDDPEQNLPYWAELWPSGIALAAEILANPSMVAGQDVLELGSGLGITAAVAVGAGANLLATDYAAESLTLTRLTSQRHAGAEPDTLQINWRNPSSALLAAHPEGYPVVLAADVLYERRDIEPLLDLFDRVVAPDGVLWLAEPGRPPASIFLESANRAGWQFTTSTWHGPWPDPNDAEVVARVHQLRRRKSVPSP